MKYYINILFIMAYISIFPQEYSLLLGISYDKDCNIAEDINAGAMQNLKTLCITTENDSLKIIADIPEIILQRDTVYWRIGIKRSLYNRYIEDQLWICPLNEEPEIKGIEVYRGETCDGYEEYKINFVNEKYIVVYNGGGGFCIGNAHPGFGYNYYWFQFDTLKDKYDWFGNIALEIPNDLSRIFNQDFYNGFLKNGKKVYDNLDEKAKWALEEVPTKIYLYRQNGKWRARGEYYWNCEVARGITEEFEVTELPTTNFIGNDELSIPWDTIKTYIPDAIDAFTSPDGKILVVDNGYSFSIYKLFDSHIPSSPSLTYDLQGLDLNVIMIKWFKDNNTCSFYKNLSNDFYEYQYNIYGPF